MDIPETKITFGRDNYNLINTNDLLVIIDSQTPSRQLTDSLLYDTTDEDLLSKNLYKVDLTIDFLGTDGFKTMEDYFVKSRTQRAYDLKKLYGITVNVPETFYNLRNLLGVAFSDRYQITLSYYYSSEPRVETLKVTTVQIEKELVQSEQATVNAGEQIITSN
jgi:hypothetical protein